MNTEHFDALDIMTATDAEVARARMKDLGLDPPDFSNVDVRQRLKDLVGYLLYDSEELDCWTSEAIAYGSRLDDKSIHEYAGANAYILALVLAGELKLDD